MRLGGRPAALAVLGLLWLAGFSLLFTVGSAVGVWPPAADPRFLHADLPVGLASGIALGLILLRRPRPSAPEA